MTPSVWYSAASAARINSALPHVCGSKASCLRVLSEGVAVWQPQVRVPAPHGFSDCSTQLVKLL